MRSLTTASLLALVVPLALLLQPATARWGVLEKYWRQQDLVILGDSLSDNGNLFALTSGTVPNASLYFEGRFSNGPVWNEVLAKSNHLKLSNFAFGGAQACNETFDIPPLAGQIALLAESGPEARKNTIVSFTIGGNDYLAPVRSLNSTPPAPEVVVGCIIAGVEELLQLGFRQILVWNLPGAVESAAGALNSPQALGALNALFLQHNELLADKLTHLQFRNPKAEIQIFDFFEASNQLLQGANLMFDFPDVPCLVFAADGETLISKCDDPDQHILFDDIHPTARVHEYLAGEVDQQLDGQKWF